MARTPVEIAEVVREVSDRAVAELVRRAGGVEPDRRFDPLIALILDFDEEFPASRGDPDRR